MEFTKKFKTVLEKATTSPIKERIIKAQTINPKRFQSFSLNTLLHDEFPNEVNLLTDGINTASKSLLLSIWMRSISVAPISNTKTNVKLWTLIFDKLNALLKLMYPNGNTFLSVTSEFRTALKNTIGSNWIFALSFEKLGIGHEQATLRREEYKNAVNDKCADRSLLQPIYTNDVFNAIQFGISSNIVVDKVIAVMLATGSRFIEVLAVSTYLTGPEPYLIRIKDIAKLSESIELQRPLVLLNSTQVIDAVHYIRSHLDLTGDHKSIASRYIERTNKRIDTVFPAIKGMTSHKLRYIAAATAYILYGQGQSESLFIQRYFGHRDPQTTRTYQCIRVERSDPVEDLPEREHGVHVQSDNEEQPGRDPPPTSPTRRIEDAPVLGLPYSQFANPKNRGGQSQSIRMNMLHNLMLASAQDGVRISIRDLKNVYGYGSKTVSEYFKLYPKTE
jgi:hypothetical protein